ncbi:D-Ala-D-Ala carboxypeptidase family metallohydrolase [Psychrobacter piscatorii]|uniref:Peptidase M15A n=2 Tax=root TaxID=1 RepID=A0A0T6DTI3_9GAMM|nr:D-Ala-D-Ala carboxypeptidase family metallohydrolase [Psychrobacter piscatorii]KRU23147.1 peptidase M15A [Psychrobacter piscatorii]
MIKSKNRNYGQIQKPILALVVCMSSISVHAAIITDSSERRIEVRQGSGDTSNAYISPSNNVSSQRPGVTMLSGANASNGDSMQSLIAQKQRDFEIDASLSIEENKRVNVNQRRATYNTTYRNNSYSTTNNTYNSANNDLTSMDFNAWLNSNSYRARQVAEYQRYLSARVGAQNVPPLSQLLTTARSWDKCGYEPYQLPPRELWANIVPTLHLYSELKNQGILPLSTEIRSVYRSPGLNDCAGGAGSSKHMNASAMDIWVPEYEDNLWRLSTMQDGLCQFWQYQGQSYNFGLGLYATGAIHLDTDGYRKWGFNHASSSSSCRY